MLAEYSNVTVLQWYLQKSKQFLHSSENGNTAMQLNVDAVDGRGYTALFVACWRGNTEGRAACAQLLIDEGADVNFKTEKL